MLYVFNGTDIAASAKKAHTLIDSLRLKRPDAAFEKIEAGSWNPAAIEGHLGGQGLFSSKYIIFLDRVTENAEAKESLSGMIAAMNESPNIFIVLEGKLTADLKRAVDKDAEKTVVSDLKEKSPVKEAPNVFALAGAFGAREAFKAWALLRQAADAGTEPEAIAGMLFWKAKSMGSASLARKIVVAYHDAHRGLNDLELSLERLVLDCAKP
jgi:DNA polymerase III delta subunit